MNSNNNIKALAPIVAVMLIAVMVVAGVTVFKIWGNEFINEKTIETGNTGNEVFELLKIENVINGDLYIRNPSKNNVTIKEIMIGGINCDVNGTSNPGITIFDVQNCTVIAGSGNKNILLISDDKVISDIKKIK